MSPKFSMFLLKAVHLDPSVLCDWFYLYVLWSLVVYLDKGTGNNDWQVSSDFQLPELGKLYSGAWPDILRISVCFVSLEKSMGINIRVDNKGVVLHWRVEVRLGYGCTCSLSRSLGKAPVFRPTLWPLPSNPADSEPSVCLGLYMDSTWFQNSSFWGITPVSLLPSSFQRTDSLFP